MRRLIPALPMLVAGALLAACATDSAVQTEAQLGVTYPLAPAVPKDERPHAEFQKLTGINGDAVSAVSGDAKLSYIYYDLFAANKAAVARAPQTYCARFGQKVKSSRVTESADRIPGIKVLVVECRG